jgi:hypothetical protein
MGWKSSECVLPVVLLCPLLLCLVLWERNRFTSGVAMPERLRLLGDPCRDPKREA